MIKFSKAIAAVVAVAVIAWLVIGWSMLTISISMRSFMILYWILKSKTVVCLLQKQIKYPVVDLCTKAIYIIAFCCAIDISLQWYEGAMLSAMSRMIGEFFITFNVFVVSSNSHRFYNENRSWITAVGKLVYIYENYDAIMNLLKSPSIGDMIASISGNSSNKKATSSSWIGKLLKSINTAGEVAEYTVKLVKDINSALEGKED